jgi:CHASE2 domain-containing sensor protein
MPTRLRALAACANTPVVRALLLGLAISVAVTTLSRVGYYAGWEACAVDKFLFFRERIPSPAIAVVAIDDDTFRALEERQPLDRRFLADTLLGTLYLQTGLRQLAAESFDEAQFLLTRRP